MTEDAEKAEANGIQLDVNEDRSIIILGENRVEISPDGKRVTAYTKDGFETKAASPAETDSEDIEVSISNDLNTVVVNGVTVSQADDGQLFIIAPGAKVSNKPLSEYSEMISEVAAAPAEEAKPVLETGQKMKDGTIYIGRFKSADGTERDWFAAAKDARKGFFKRGKRLALSFNDAVYKYARKSKAHGHRDWMLPPGDDDINGAPDILNAMFENKDKIGGFDETGSNYAGWYWSSSSFVHNGAYGTDQRFSDGKKHQHFVHEKLSVRFVRSVPVTP